MVQRPERPTQNLALRQEREKHAKPGLAPEGGEVHFSSPFREQILETCENLLSGGFTTGYVPSSLRLGDQSTPKTEFKAPR